MKRPCPFLQVIPLLFMGVEILQAHVGRTIYPIYELPTSSLPDLHDGTLEDWEEIVPGPSLTMIDFAGPDREMIDPSDLAVRVYLGWNGPTQRLYLAVERVDDVYINTYEGGDLSYLWAYDSIEFGIDGDHSGGSYACFGELDGEEFKFAQGFQAQRYAAITESPDGRMIGYEGAGNAWVTLPPYTDIGSIVFDSMPHVSWTELYVTPWDRLNYRGPELSGTSLLSANKIIGFQLVMFDYDRSPQQLEDVFLVEGELGMSCTADRFIDGRLVPCDGPGCGFEAEQASVIQHDSWARIKLSFLE